MSQPKDFSSQTYTPGAVKPVKSQPVDSSGRSKEKQDMVSLNDKFVSLIDKVKALENDKKKLSTKLKILKKHEDYSGKVDELVRQQVNQLEQHIENLLNDQEKLKDELAQDQKERDDTKKKYEDAVVEKNKLESDFVVTKRSVDEGHMKAVDLALELEDLLEKLKFLRAGHDEELKELESQVQNETVILPDVNSRSLDMEEVVKTIEVQYANMAARTRDEAEQWNQKKMDALVLTAGKQEQDLRDIKREISDLIRLIQKLNGELDLLKRKEDSLRKEIDDAGKDCEATLNKSHEDIGKLEEALKSAKQDLAYQIRHHQELLNLKLSLDIEIATYTKLLEGEEQRMKELLRHVDVHLPSKPHPPPEKPQAAAPTSSPKTSTTPQDIDKTPPALPKKLLIRLQVESGRIVSKSSHYTE